MTQDVQCYTWSQFAAAVMGLLPIDSQRIGPTAGYIAQLLRLGVIELQNYIPAYRKDHETLYQASDFVGEGFASRAALPPQAQPKDAFLVYYETNADKTPKSKCVRFPLDNYPWHDRMHLVHGHVAVNDGRGKICFDSHGETFYIYPPLRDGQNVSLFWDGMKINFQPDEQTPFDEQMTLVVADFLKMRLSREVDKDLPLKADYEQDYMKGRSLLFLNTKDRGRTNI